MEKTHATEECRGDVVPAWWQPLLEVVYTRRKAKDTSRFDAVDLICVVGVTLAAETPTRRRRRGCSPASTAMTPQRSDSEAENSWPSENGVVAAYERWTGGCGHR